MATVYLIFALLVAIVAVIFALQNTAAITISFFLWQISGSLALVILVTLAVGVLIGWLFIAPSMVKGSFQGASQRKRIAALEKEVSDYKASLEKLQAQVKTLEADLAAARAAAASASSSAPSVTASASSASPASPSAS